MATYQLFRKRVELKDARKPFTVAGKIVSVVDTHYNDDTSLTLTLLVEVSHV